MTPDSPLQHVVAGPRPGRVHHERSSVSSRSLKSHLCRPWATRQCRGIGESLHDRRVSSKSSSSIAAGPVSVATFHGKALQERLPAAVIVARVARVVAGVVAGPPPPSRDRMAAWRAPWPLGPCACMMHTHAHVYVCACTYACKYVRISVHICMHSCLCALGQWEGQHFCRTRHCHAPCSAASRWT